MDIICALISIFIVTLFVRAVLSWFPVEPGTFLAQLNAVLRDLTEWALAPLRRAIPPAGMFDLSFLALTLGLLVLRQAIC